MLTQSLHRHVLVLFLITALLAPVAEASKGGGPFKDGQKAEAAGDYDAAVAFYDRAVSSDLRNAQYNTALRRSRFLAAMRHLDAGHKLRDQGKLDEALLEFRKSQAFDPSTSIADQEINRTQLQIEARKLSGPRAEDSLTPQQVRQREYERRMATAESPAELMPTNRAPINLRATNESKMLYETIGKIAGINVLTDPDYQGKRISVDLVNVTPEQAFDYLGVLSKSLWSPITSNTIIIYGDSKRREREPWVMKTVYLSNTTLPQEITELTQVLRNVADITKIQQVNSQNAIIIRATPDQMAIAEKIIADIDKARSEVVVDVTVMSVQRDLTRQFGISPISGGAPGIQLPVSFSPGGLATSAGTATAVTLKGAGSVHLTDFSTILPGGTINALASDANTKILQNPQLRASDGQLAKLRIGQRIPIATGTFSQPGVATGGLAAAQTQFQYTDVGVTMDITPRVNAGKEVSLKVVIEISEVDTRVSIGGVDQPVIGQRRIEQDIRLKEGEANVLGGILQDQQTVTRAGVPILGQIPILGHFFSTDSKTVSQSELLIVLTPHIVRYTDYSELNLRGIDSGTAAAVGLRYKPVTSPAITATPTNATPGVPAPTQPSASVPPPPATATQPAPDVPSGVHLLFPDAAMTVPLAGSTGGPNFKVNLDIAGAQEVNAVPFQLKFDPKVVKLISVDSGDFLTKDGQMVSLAPTIDPVAGTAIVAVTRPPSAPGISGTGRLLVLTFAPVAPGTGKVQVMSGSVRGPMREPRPLPPAEMTITVK